MDEWQVIERIKARLKIATRQDSSNPQLNNGVVVGIGDDAAVCQVKENLQLVMSMDTLVSGVHFREDVDPGDLGYKLCAVNLSDLASMGALPKWALMSLSLPRVDPTWLDAFLDGYLELAHLHDLSTVGGDVVKGSLSATLQVTGVIEKRTALLRSTAQAGDAVLVSGTIGDAAVAFKLAEGGMEVAQDLHNRLVRPTPRVALGRALRGVASAAIDISDGLISELNHLSQQSQVRIRIDPNCVPVSDCVAHYLSQMQDLSTILTGGDDYELCCVCPQENVKIAIERALEVGVSLTQIGYCELGQEVLIEGMPQISQKGYRHHWD